MAHFIKNILEFIKRVVVSNEDDFCCNAEKPNKTVIKSKWLSHDRYLETKYKRVNIYNGETNSTPQVRFGEGKASSDKEVLNKCCSATKLKKSNNSNERKKKKMICKQQKRLHTETKKKMQEEQEEEEESTEYESVIEDDDNDSKDTASQCPELKKNKEKKINSCQQIDEKLKAMILVVRQKCLNKKFNEIEQHATTLWRDFSTKLPQCQKCNAYNKDWHSLKCIDKLLFYWAAISGSFLHENPFDNFLRFYLDENGIEDTYIQDCKFMQHVQKLWCQMEEKEKMPFIMETFMYKVSLGKVNMQSDISIKNELQKILNRSVYHDKD